ncbi:MAG TPA: ribonuclease P protein component [Gemmatimonadaceae bacterium]|nr:ribonuclease P protein component [Gemmatimonadaceae bacterium]
MARRFPRSRRLTRGADLQTVRREGKRIRTEHLEVRATASLSRSPSGGGDDVASPDDDRRPGPEGGRVGIVVPKHKHSSVERNLLKRRLRELARTLLLPDLPPSVDLVVRTFPESYDAPWATLEREVRRVREKLGRLFSSGVER